MLFSGSVDCSISHNDYLVTFCNHLPKKKPLANYVKCSHQNASYSYINVVDLTMYFNQEYGFVHIFANTVISTLEEGKTDSVSGICASYYHNINKQYIRAVRGTHI